MPAAFEQEVSHMRKIICELCGTVYPDTAENCPTCGSEKPASVEFIPESPEESGSRREYTPTKGGRFSNSNVKKRLQGKGVAPVPAPAPKKKPAQPQAQPSKQQTPRKEQPKAKPKQENSGSNKGLVITAILLIIAIIAMLIYIYVNFLMPPAQKPEDTKDTTPAIPEQTTTAPTTAPDLSCKGLTLSTSEITLEAEGASWLLNVTADPVDTTDAVTFSSSDPTIAEVSADGMITAVSAGEAVITVTCGSLEATCKVICNIVPETTVPPTTVPPTTEAVIELKLNRSDITFSSKGEAWPLYKGEIPLTDITWSVGNENVATIRNGTVRAVGPGTTTVYAEYQGQKVSCIIRCNFS
jgi:hypothetical protein